LSNTNRAAIIRRITKIFFIKSPDDSRWNQFSLLPEISNPNGILMQIHHPDPFPGE
jgi:hypothetical protein